MMMMMMMMMIMMMMMMMMMMRLLEVEGNDSGQRVEGEGVRWGFYLSSTFLHK